MRGRRHSRPFLETRGKTKSDSVRLKRQKVRRGRRTLLINEDIGLNVSAHCTRRTSLLQIGRQPPIIQRASPRKKKNSSAAAALSSLKILMCSF